MKNEKTIYFKQIIEKYLRLKKCEVEEATIINYRCKANIANNEFGDIKINKIKASQIKDWIIDLFDIYSNKTINEIFIVLRGAFQYAMDDQLIEINPMDSIKNLKIKKYTPDPFKMSEITALMKLNNVDENGQNLFALGVNTGLRICELIALTWEDISFDKQWLIVKRANVLGHYKTPKTTESTRKIRLNEHSLAILKKQFSLTGHLPKTTFKCRREDLKTIEKELGRFVFIPKNTGHAYENIKEYREKFFRGFCNAAGITFKGPSNVRHTFASQAITAGASEVWVAKQLGHTTTKMVSKHYGALIDEDAPDYTQKLANHYKTMNVFPQTENNEKECSLESDHNNIDDASTKDMKETDLEKMHRLFSMQQELFYLLKNNQRATEYSFSSYESATP
jgi:integrase